ncbi:1605_t:CDS:2 [Entrophospora sp. SA101]|nr:1605_t:CDS:2 [Entrophospora sp. SA101]
MALFYETQINDDIVELSSKFLLDLRGRVVRNKVILTIRIFRKISKVFMNSSRIEGSFEYLIGISDSRKL